MHASTPFSPPRSRLGYRQAVDYTLLLYAVETQSGGGSHTSHETQAPLFCLLQYFVVGNRGHTLSSPPLLPPSLSPHRFNFPTCSHQKSGFGSVCHNSRPLHLVSIGCAQLRWKESPAIVEEGPYFCNGRHPSFPTVRQQPARWRRRPRGGRRNRGANSAPPPAHGHLRVCSESKAPE